MPQFNVQDPAAVLDYSIDWSAIVGDDPIVISVWVVPMGLTIVQDTYSATHTVVWVTGGEVDAMYDITSHIVTAAGREDERTITILIKDR